MFGHCNGVLPIDEGVVKHLWECHLRCSDKLGVDGIFVLKGEINGMNEELAAWLKEMHREHRDPKYATVYGRYKRMDDTSKRIFEAGVARHRKAVAAIEVDIDPDAIAEMATDAQGKRAVWLETEDQFLRLETMADIDREARRYAKEYAKTHQRL